MRAGGSPGWLLALWLGLGPGAALGQALGQGAPAAPPVSPAVSPATPSTPAPGPTPGRPAPQRVTVRTGLHPGFSRLVFDWPQAPGYSLVQKGEAVELVFGAAGQLAFEAAAVRPPRNILAVEPMPGGLRLRLAPGSRARHFVLGNRVVVDLLDPPEPPTPPAAAGSASAASAAPPPRRAPSG
ncbi:hypothetical protein NON00_24470, partial [Roseomonas sp. GC11]|nr:hypothetical protein [Roseomonas sp. GC11]